VWEEGAGVLFEVASVLQGVFSELSADSASCEEVEAGVVEEAEGSVQDLSGGFAEVAYVAASCGSFA